MTKSKKLLTALIISAIIISSSGCEFSPETPVINSETELTSSESSSSLPEITEDPESSEPEETVEAEPVIETVFTLLSNSAERGGYFTLKAENTDLSEFVFNDPFGYERRFFEKEGAWFCFIPVKTSTNAGYYPLKISSEKFDFNTTLTVLERDFEKQYLTVAKETLEVTLENEAARVAFDNFFQEYRWTLTKEPLWNGEFVAPLGSFWYNETTSFGTFRTFSNGDTEWHNAIDMAVGGGTPIYATNSGKILFADWLGVTGNTVVIDHGCGVMSWHYHLHKINVATGDFVEKNTVIGTVGTTGLSTGNHLHFGITVGGIFTDPMAMIGTEPDLDFGEAKAE